MKNLSQELSNKLDRKLKLLFLFRKARGGDHAFERDGALG
jgi:hypothetical protein